MSRPMLLADFVRLPPAIRGDVVEGLAAAIDTVAERGAASHRFLRFGWYAAALAAYGGQARTLVVEEDGAPVLTLPFVPFGPGFMRMAAVPGCYWPFRSFGVALGATDATFKVALSILASHVNALRIGPVQDDDSAVRTLVNTARAQGWVAIDRLLGETWTLDLPPLEPASEHWPRNSTLRKNRFHEKHLAEHGVPKWRFLSGADWPTGFGALGTIEAASWVGQADRTDPKFAHGAHLAFWQAAVADTALAAMFRAALLTIDGDPAAFSFDIDTGDLLHAVANSYHPRFAKHSPGKLLQWRNIVTARDRGVRRIDWGSGDSGYKQVLGAGLGSPIRDWILLKPGLPALAGRAFNAFGQKSFRSNNPA